MNDQKTEQKKPSKAKEYGLIAAIVAGVIAFFVIFVYLPIKLIPAVFSSLPSKQTATVLTSTPVSNESGSGANNQPASAPASGNAPAQNSAAKTAAAPSYYGLPDLEVQLVSTGIVNRYSGQYVATPYAGQNDEVAVQFIVRNVGTNVSGPFRLRLNMPSSVTPFYESPYQQSILPGDAIEFTGSFDGPLYQGINTGYITIDPYNEISEISKANNNLAVQFNISGTNYTGAMPQVALPYGTFYQWVNMSLTCSGFPQTTYIGNPVTWTAAASGGNGYFTYVWVGSDGLSSSGSNSVTKTYYTSGTKFASVTVTSGGQSITQQCIVNVI